ncbi:hypothetical protein [Streptomyces sp. NPDC002215]
MSQKGPDPHRTRAICIKITPTDIKDLFTRLDRAGWPKNLALQVS